MTVLDPPAIPTSPPNSLKRSWMECDHASVQPAKKSLVQVNVPQAVMDVCTPLSRIQTQPRREKALEQVKSNMLSWLKSIQSSTRENMS